MLDDRIQCIVYNAFNGLGDVTGSDEYGISVGWVDVDDYLEPNGLDNYELYPTSDSVTEYVKTHPKVDSRWILAFWTAGGTRYIETFKYRAEMLKTFREFENEFAEWLEEEI